MVLVAVAGTGTGSTSGTSWSYDPILAGTRRPLLFRVSRICVYFEHSKFDKFEHSNFDKFEHSNLVDLEQFQIVCCCILLERYRAPVPTYLYIPVVFNTTQVAWTKSGYEIFIDCTTPSSSYQVRVIGMYHLDYGVFLLS
eukprot:SAG11_NODE_16939_length_533_cov_0.875576_1_plen_139_part_10